MQTPQPHAEENGTPNSEGGRLAHDVFNLITVVFGMQDELAALQTNDPRKAQLQKTFKIVADRLDLIGKRIHAMNRREAEGGQESGGT